MIARDQDTLCSFDDDASIKGPLKLIRPFPALVALQARGDGEGGEVGEGHKCEFGLGSPGVRVAGEHGYHPDRGPTTPSFPAPSFMSSQTDRRGLTSVAPPSGCASASLGNTSGRSDGDDEDLEDASEAFAACSQLPADSMRGIAAVNETHVLRVASERTRRSNCPASLKSGPSPFYRTIFDPRRTSQSRPRGNHL